MKSSALRKAAPAKAEAAAKTGKASPSAAAHQGAGERSPFNPVWTLLATGVQTKLEVSSPDDPLEKEADAVADRVLRMPDRWSAQRPAPEPGVSSRGPPIQRKCKSCEEDEQAASLVQREIAPAPAPPIAAFAAPRLSRKCAACEAEDEAAPASAFESYLATSRGGGVALQRAARDRFEPRFGRDFSAVRVHADGGSARAAAAINAHAFTTGSDIHFGAGRYQPGTPQGDRLLAHELVHTIQQTGGHARASSAAVADAGGNGIAIARAAAPRLQRWPSASDIVDSIEDTIDDAGAAAADVVDTVGGAVGEVVQDVGEGLDAAGQAIGGAVEEVVDTGRAVGSAIADAGEEAVDWLATEAGQLATQLADALGVSVSVTAEGLEIDVGKICPLDAFTKSFDLESIDGEYMVPVVAIPIGTVAVTGEIGLTGHIEPVVAIQLGPICLEGLRIRINPLTGTFSISGSISAAVAASLAAELRGGLRGAVSLKGVVLIGDIPVPVDVPLAGAEGGLAGLVRGIGATKLTIGGSLGVGSGGAISVTQSRDLDLGLAGDLFAGAYAQIDVLGENLCRIYWQPYEWHGDIAGTVGISVGLTVAPGGSPSVVPTISPPTFGSIPFSHLPLALSREGFSDDCPIIDRICAVLRALGLLPSQNGGEWNWSGPYGPGPRLAGPLDVYQKNPGIASGSECRGACGPNCDTCTPIPSYRYTDPATGDTWEYRNFQDCNTNEGCRQHDAAFDWAAAVHGETGSWAIIMPWHMAANIECACNNLAGNCIAWIAGLPPYDNKMYFADSAAPVGHGGGGVGPAIGDCAEQFPNAPPCDASHPDRDQVLEDWGRRNQITGFRDCTIVDNLTTMSAIDCGGGPGNLWNCTATDVVTGEDLTVGIFECICCNDDDSSSSVWMEPYVVVDPTTMSQELILELCDRNLIPRVICIPFEDDMIARFGNRGRDLGIDPDTDPKSNLRPDDAPVIESFKRMYNRLDSWTIFMRSVHPELEAEFTRTFRVEARRSAWLDEIKRTGDEFKARFRDIGNADPEELRTRYEQVLARIEQEIDDLNHQIAAWYQARTGAPGTLDEIIEDVHQQGTELWRAAWRRAILQVNRVLARLWPPAKGRLLLFVGQIRARHPDKDLSGPVGELDYLGSLASGFKGPPKQNIRFNPSSFDVDGFIEAPPLSKYCVLVLGMKPKHGNIFSRNTDIEPLITFSDAVQVELVSKVDGYKDDPGDPFDVAIKMDDLPEQGRGKAATERLYRLRETLPTERYEAMVDELRAGGFLVVDAKGTRIREELSEAEADGVKKIMDKFEAARTAPPVQRKAMATAP